MWASYSFTTLKLTHSMCQVSLIVKYSLNPPVISILTVLRQCNFCDFFVFVFAILSCLFLQPCVHLCVMFLCVLSVSHTGLVHVSIPDLCLLLYFDISIL